VIRYAGQPLPERPRIAVLANDAIGNFVVATPLLQMLRAERFPSMIAYFGGRRTWEFQTASELFDATEALHGSDDDGVRALVEKYAGSFDLIVNLERTDLAKRFASSIAGKETLVSGPALGPVGDDLPFASDDRGKLWEDQNWKSKDLLQRYPFLDTPFIGEIFCRLCYLDSPMPDYKLPRADPPIELPQLWISMSASLPEKLWRPGAWRDVLRRARSAGRSVGLLGATRRSQREHWLGADVEDELVEEGLVQDWRGRMSLPQVVGALKRARAVLTIDNGILHMAVAARAPTVGLYRHGIHRLWAPPSDRLTVLTPGDGRSVDQIDAGNAWTAVLEAM